MESGLVTIVDPILIFGGVDGIGGDLARRLAAAGHHVALTSRSSERATAFAKEIGAQPLTGDVCDEGSIVAAYSCSPSLPRPETDAKTLGLVAAVE